MPEPASDQSSAPDTAQNARPDPSAIYPEASRGRLKSTDDPSASYRPRAKIINLESSDDIQHLRRENNRARAFDDRVWLLCVGLTIIASPFYIFRNVSPVHRNILYSLVAIVIFLFVYAIIRSLKSFADSKSRDRQNQKDQENQKNQNDQQNQ